MSAVTATRWSLGTAGLALGLYGGWLLATRQDGAQLKAVATWLVGGVLLHDVLLAAAVIAVGALLTRVLPVPAQAPAAAAGIVLGSVTLLAIPVLGRYGAKSDNPTLLDRDYGTGWFVFAGLVVVVALAAALLRLRRERSRSGVQPGTDPVPDAT